MNVLEYISNVTKAYSHMNTMIITFNFEKEITKYGKIVHKPKGKFNLIIVKGEGNIDLGRLYIIKYILD